MSNQFDDDEIELMPSSASKSNPAVLNEGFVSHMTRFDDTIKGELMNIVQYTSLGIVPVLLLNKIVNAVFPELDEDKASWELGAEVLGQLFVMFVGVFYVHRLVTFVSPYSGHDYPTVSIIMTILPILMLLLSIQSKISSKSNVLYHRLMVLLGQEEEDAAPVSKQPEQYFRVSQPIASHPSVSGTHPVNEGGHPQMREGMASMGPIPQQQMVHEQVAPPPQMPQQMPEPQSYLQPANEIGGGFSSW